MIPKTVWHIWLGGDEPEYSKRNRMRSAELNPDWDHILVTDLSQTLRRSLRANGLVGMTDLFDSPYIYSPRSHPEQYRSNLARYVLLYEHGGVYLDADMQPRVPFRDWLDRDGGLVAGWEIQDRKVNNAFIGCPARHPAMGAVLSGVRKSIRSNRNKRSTWQSGVHYLSGILPGRDDVTIYPQDRIYPYGWYDVKGRDDERDEGDAWLIHHWANQRRRNGLPDPP